MPTEREDPNDTVRLAPTPDAPAQARQFLEEFARDHGGVAGACLEDARLAVSELVANAVQHTGTPVTVHLAVTGDGLEVSVGDEGPGVPRMRPAGRGGIGGIGLVLIDRVAQRWGVLFRQGGKVVWCLLRPRIQGPLDTRASDL